jgi:hypothetical protein
VGWKVKGSGRAMKGIEGTKVKYTHSRNTWRNPLNIDLELKIKDRAIK